MICKSEAYSNRPRRRSIKIQRWPAIVPGSAHRKSATTIFVSMCMGIEWPMVTSRPGWHWNDEKKKHHETDERGRPLPELYAEDAWLSLFREHGIDHVILCGGVDG